ncbi:RYP3/VelB [Blumeria hordei DH14]|uniref:RYP3/VelB n=1 Tax=Blumeria graminis f. sp. hordei (strain DH14) TaxID=546991 RepID=N1J6R8_BLUG1|nr:RYP3/VelB [Blumeria hordei DH14]
MRPTTRPTCSWPRRARPSPTPCTLATGTRRTSLPPPPLPCRRRAITTARNTSELPVPPPSAPRSRPQTRRRPAAATRAHVWLRRQGTLVPAARGPPNAPLGPSADHAAAVREAHRHRPRHGQRVRFQHGTFVLNVDLWSADGKAEVNLVRQTANSPSISSTISVPYQDNTAGATTAYHLPSTVKSDAGPPAYAHFANDAVNSFSPQHQHLQTYNGQPAYHATFSQPPTSQQMYFTPAALHAASPSSPYADSGPGQASPYPARAFPPPDSHRMPATSPPQGMFTRNLIGSLTANASRLTDPEDKIGIWFVLQDLSVRTEGDFRLRFSFVNVSEISPPSSAHLSANSSAPLNKNKSPVLARCFSDVFSVYSAKRFPGVVESTPLSRCFATQGIRIPIRKDATKGEKEKDEDED